MATQAESFAADRHGGMTSRVGFQRDLDALVDQVRGMGALASAALEQALRALADQDVALCDRVIDGDHALDERFLGIQREVLRLIARQAPVASDARLVTAAMHIGLHLERIGDLAVNVAELTKLSAGLPRDPVVLASLRAMGAIALDMVAAAIKAFSDRDADACPRLASTDDRVDDLKRAVMERVLAIQTPGERRRSSMYMDEVAQQLERAGDHAVDIGEQVWFMVTGELREFTSPARIRRE